MKIRGKFAVLVGVAALLTGVGPLLGAWAAGPRHRYHIKYAESRDGARWDRRGLVCIDYQSPDEYAFGRPCVIKDADRYRMWYSRRGDSYRMGYAESRDGIAWTRDDERCVLDVSSGQGWDAEMVSYPHVFELDGRTCLFYLGDQVGRHGFGLAELDGTLA